LLKSSQKPITKYFLTVVKNISLLAAIYIGDNLAANQWHQMLLLLLLQLNVVHLENI